MSSASDADGGGTRTPKKREGTGFPLIVLVALRRCLLCGASFKVPLFKVLIFATLLPQR